MDVVRRNVASRNPHYPLRVVGGEQNAGLYGYSPGGESAVLERLPHDYYWGNQRTRFLFILLRNSTISQVEPRVPQSPPVDGTTCVCRRGRSRRRNMSVMGSPWYSQMVGPFPSRASAPMYYYSIVFYFKIVGSVLTVVTLQPIKPVFKPGSRLSRLRLFVASSFTPDTFQIITSNLFTTDSFQILAILLISNHLILYIILSVTDRDMKYIESK